MSLLHVCIHGHFYQPSRTDPFNGRVPPEADATPYENWNERITAECYHPNACAGNFARISFNVGETLAEWLQSHHPATYEQVTAQMAAYHRRNGVPSALAQPMHHTILPLARRRDQECQVRWGIAAYEHRFGTRPLGVWLPEMAVDLEVLDLLASEQVRFTVLSEEQVKGDLPEGAGPYKVLLPSGQDIAVFVRDRDLSNALSFNMPPARDAERWLSDRLNGRCGQGSLVLIATDGETFGHHHPQGAQVLTNITQQASAQGWDLTTLGLYFRRHEPRATVEINEDSAWSCSHGLNRWALGCTCTPGDSRWKPALRRALDNLATELDSCYAEELTHIGFEPWSLRDRYVFVILGTMGWQALLLQSDHTGLTTSAAQRLRDLLLAQYYRQQMYSSCAFFFDSLDRLEPSYAIANAARAAELTRAATGNDLTDDFRRDLRLAEDTATGRTAEDIFDQIVEGAQR
jgi:alpha-amylase/alpha-mannosidase (GH57 family)